VNDHSLFDGGKLNITSKQDAITRIDLQDFRAGWKQHILFLSDIHFDSDYCETKLLKKHLDEALDKDAIILIAGDLFDGMQGHNDPRRSYKELKEKYKGIDYFDRIKNDAVDFFMPYKNNLAMLGYGNHEYSIVHFNGTDLVQRFVSDLRKEGSQIVSGGYGGYIRIGIHGDSMKTPFENLRIYYNHGAGGEAPVTKGMIQTNRQATYVRGVDVIWNGHNHQEYISHQATIEITTKDVVKQGLVTFIRTPGYKNEWGDQSHGFNGFASSKMMAPTPRGCAWGELSYENPHKISNKFMADVI
jgi:UDP-2,3-diacylglucosamine pyrophosphatase LpxH